MVVLFRTANPLDQLSLELEIAILIDRIVEIEQKTQPLFLESRPIAPAKSTIDVINTAYEESFEAMFWLSNSLDYIFKKSSSKNSKSKEIAS